MREISFEKIEDIKEGLKINYSEIAALLGVSPTQVHQYKRSGSVPADRYYAARDALLVHAEDEARESRERIVKLFSGDL